MEKATQNSIRSTVIWIPAILLLLAQLVTGMRDLPQSTFFLIYLQEKIGLGTVTISSIVAAAQVVGMGVALLGGAITNRLGSKRVLVVGMLLCGVSSLAFQVHASGLAAFLWLFGGAGLALVAVGGSSYLTHLGTQGTLGTISAFYALSMTIGGAIGNPAAGVLIERFGFSLYGWTIIGLSTAAIVVLAVFMSNTVAYAKNPIGEPPPVGILSALRQTKIWLLVGLRSLPTLFYGMLSVLVPLMLNGLAQDKILVAAYGTTTLVVASIAQLVAGKAADRWGTRAPTLASYTVMIVAGIGLFASSKSIQGLFVFGVLGISAAWCLSTMMYLWVADGIAAEKHPETFGLLHAVWSLSMVGGSLLGGWLARLAPGLPFLVLGLANLGACALAVRYYQPKVLITA